MLVQSGTKQKEYFVLKDMNGLSNIIKESKPYSTARSVEDETRNGHRNANRNANWNHETIILCLFLFENLQREMER